MDVVRQTPEHWDFNITGCRYADFFRRLGEPELGALLLCEQDIHVTDVVGRPDVKLERTQTIMKGAQYCDFRWSMNRGEAKYRSDAREGSDRSPRGERQRAHALAGGGESRCKPRARAAAAPVRLSAEVALDEVDISGACAGGALGTHRSWSGSRGLLDLHLQP
jgi:hypothetical protein